MTEEEAIAKARKHLKRSGKSGIVTAIVENDPQGDYDLFSKKQNNDFLKEVPKYWSGSYWAFQFDTNNPSSCIVIINPLE